MDKQLVKKLCTFTMLLTSVATTPLISHAQDSRDVQRDPDRTENWHRPWRERAPTPKLFDARGTVVGDIALGRTSSDDGGVVLDIDGVLVYVGFERISLDGGFTRSATQMRWSGSEPFYGGANCTGTAYIWYINSPLRPVSIMRQGSQVTLLIAVEGREEHRTLVSNSEGGTCIGNYAVPNDVWRVERTFDLTSKYPEPLRVGF
ncbi:hypothetical protein AWB67_04749 [Caballeronia terrestris]|uniref:Lipoprotein n=1 Tax=Caballeronia terrestris TaxID=1226301 RepID=A0A158K330_9BURK|nr:hypothetical protein AWB67_04749 [Caballeronia terrestris]